MVADLPDWLMQFPQLSSLDAESARLLARSCRVIRLKAGDWLFREGDLCQNYMLILDGQVMVRKVSETGREIVLYRVEAGESCIMTTTCLIGGNDYTAEGLAETDLRAVVIPDATFHAMLDRSDAFRRFVFQTCAKRLSGLFSLIEEVCFQRIDMRLARLLLDRAEDGGTVAATHQEMAVELGTAREVVSRQLKEFERRGWITLGRGRLTVTDADRLAALAAPSSSL